MPFRRNRVRFTSTAHADLDAIAAWYTATASIEAADRNISEILDAGYSLDTMPHRGRFASEGRLIGTEARQLLRVGLHGRRR